MEQSATWQTKNDNIFIKYLEYRNTFNKLKRKGKTEYCIDIK